MSLRHRSTDLHELTWAATLLELEAKAEVLAAVQAVNRIEMEIAKLKSVPAAANRTEAATATARWQEMRAEARDRLRGDLSRAVASLDIARRHAAKHSGRRALLEAYRANLELELRRETERRRLENLAMSPTTSPDARYP